MSGSLVFAIVLACAALAGAAGFAFWYQRRIRRQMDTVLERLDRAIGGTIQENTYDESIESAVTQRLNQLVEMSRLNCDQADKERNLVKALISDISHQVRTPLTNIMLYAGLLEEQELSENAGEMASRIHRQADKLDFFMKELMRSSYLETDMITVHVEKSSVDELIARACQAVEMQALKKEIVIEAAPSSEQAFFDMKWTVEALVNLLDNAVKYSPVGSVVRICAIPYESFLCIRVKDEGIGIREEEQGMIFRRFYRSPSVSGEKGLGIGLYLVREIIKKQAGYVKVKAEPGVGAEFFVYLRRD
ncbi:Sensor histidine kinase ResE [Blautia producta]|uniref:histidine kinase n=1 Tax=Blautia producta TaxID=33035 RepID=A0A4P6LRN3_9FIRM|nr:HAMP domain-containing sensor histidine kinase [Blautia producta]QBE94804.1 Sensor histidine kinase ResE [Blautia producta]